MNHNLWAWLKNIVYRSLVCDGDELNQEETHNGIEVVVQMTYT